MISANSPTNSSPSGPSRWARDEKTWVRLAFAALLLFAPVQYIAGHYGPEPWPTLRFPAFTAVSDPPQHYALKSLSAYTTDGERIDFDWEDVYPTFPGITQNLLAKNFSSRSKPPSPDGYENSIASRVGNKYPFRNYWLPKLGLPHGNDPDTRAWLKAGLEEEYPGKTFDRLEFGWYSYTGWIHTEEIPDGARKETYVVNFH